ncbi:MAG: hypothetical protein NC923_05865 [Candidatus Omnitrophica bacterium]|nr:hypothetical protein [Candidatus Omnitrophota bacterium]
MKKKDKLLKLLLIMVFLGLGIWYVAIFGGANIIKFYVASGIGDCGKIPILCMLPIEKITVQANKECIAEFLPYSFSKIQVYLPKGFNVTCELTKKAYYKRKAYKQRNSYAYLLYEEPGFFLELFPQLKKAGVKNNYEFIERVMCANYNGIKNINDAFFVIMKSIFIPDLGDQRKVRMMRIAIGNKRGFLSYNIDKDATYFESSLIDDRDQFFKICVKDRSAKIGQEQIFAIISTLDKP